MGKNHFSKKNERKYLNEDSSQAIPYFDTKLATLERTEYRQKNGQEETTEARKSSP